MRHMTFAACLAALWLGSMTAHAQPPNTVVAQVTQPKVTMYATSWCPYCRAARNYFNANNIAFEEVDIEKSTEGRQAYRDLGGRGVPLIVVGRERIHGFNQPRLDALLKNPGR